MERNINLTVNGEIFNIDIDDERSLVSVLRDDLGFREVKQECDDGSCRSCTVMMGKEVVRPLRAVKSCTIKAVEADGTKIETEKLYYPMFVDIMGRRCLVVGGGEVACRKVEAIVKYGAKVHVISPEFNEEMERMIEDRVVTAEKREFKRGDLDGFFLVIGATDDNSVNREIYAEAEERGILCNIVDVPPLCGFIVPSIAKRGALQIAISTAGKSPAFSRTLRQKFEEEFGDEYAQFLEVMGGLREVLKDKYPEDENKRKEIFERLVRSDLLDSIRIKDEERIQEILSECTS